LTIAAHAVYTLYKLYEEDFMKKAIAIRNLFLAPALGLAALLALAAPVPVAAKGQSAVAQNTATAQQGQAKYVFLFIGDGMAMAQISSTEVYATARSSKDINITRLGFTRFPVSGLTTTYDAGTFITDSASAVTAIATGNKTLSGVINMDPAKRQNYKTIAEYAHEAGMKVGVVSTVTLDHATPAGFSPRFPPGATTTISRSRWCRAALNTSPGAASCSPGGRIRTSGTCCR
jgi:alkaline phosphatase